VIALAAGRNLECLADQVRQFRPGLVAVADATDATVLREQFPGLAVMAGRRTGRGGDPSGGHHGGGRSSAPRARTHLARLQLGREILLANKETWWWPGSW